MRAYQPTGPVQERLAGVRLEERREVPVVGRRHQRDRLLREGERDDQRDHDQPHSTADAAAARASRRAKPERLADRRPAEGSLLATDEGRDEDELPDHADREGHDQRLSHRHIAGAGEPVGERGRDEPGEHGHR